VTEADCWGGEVAEEDIGGVMAPLARCICLKNGFFDPESVDDVTGSDGTEGGFMWEIGVGSG